MSSDDRSCASCAEARPQGARFCTRCGAPFEPDAPPAVAPGATDATVAEPLVAGRYALGKRVGQGGLATVYRAEDRVTGGPVAIKLVAAGATGGAAERLLHEGQVVARLTHPNVVRLRDLGRLPDGGAYLALEWVEGDSLATVLGGRTGPLAVPEALDVAGAVAAALAAAHAIGIVHRDVKPQNVLVPRRGARYDFAAAQLADFGVQGALDTVGGDGRMLTQTGFVVGTPAYMAPEQLLGGPQSTATDLFGLGTLLFEMLFGAPPGGRGTPAQLFASRLQAEVELPARPDVPEPLRALLAGLLRREPTARPQSAPAVAEELRRLREPLGRDPALIDALEPPAAQATFGGAPARAHPPAAPARPPADFGPPAGLPAGAGLPNAAPTPSVAAARARSGPIWIALALAIVVGALVAGWSAAAGRGPGWQLAAQPVVAVAAGLALFSAVTWAIDRRRATLAAESAGLNASVQSALLGGMPLDRDGISRTIATTVEAIIERCRSLDERLIGQTIVAIAREYGSDASTPDSRMAALVQIPQQLERLEQKISARSTPWYVRHEKLLAAAVSGTTVLGGLAKTALDIAAAVVPKAPAAH